MCIIANYIYFLTFQKGALYKSGWRVHLQENMIEASVIKSEYKFIKLVSSPGHFICDV